MSLGENIYRCRVAKNWSQGNLADALDVSRQSISKWENNLAAPDLDKLIRLHDVFDVSLDELILGDIPEDPAENVPTPDTAVAENTAIPAPSAYAPPALPLTVRHMVGFAMLLFGLIFFLLAIFWGDSLYFKEEVGEILAVLIVMISIFVLAPYNQTLISICGIVYFGYSVICFSVLKIDTIVNSLFLFFASMVLLVWFIVAGLHANRQG